MLSYSDLTGRIKTIISEASGISELIYEYEVYAKGDWSKYLEKFKNAAGKIHAWEITRHDALEIEDTTSVNTRTHQIIIRGYHGLGDEGATEKTIWQPLIDAVCTTLRNSMPSLNDLPGVQMISPPTASPIENRMFGSVLCHFVEIRLNVDEHIQWR